MRPTSSGGGGCSRSSGPPRRRGAVRFNEFKQTLETIPPRTLAARLVGARGSGRARAARPRYAAPAGRVPAHRHGSPPRRDGRRDAGLRRPHVRLYTDFTSARPGGCYSCGTARSRGGITRERKARRRRIHRRARPLAGPAPPPQIPATRAQPTSRSRASRRTSSSSRRTRASVRSPSSTRRSRICRSTSRRSSRI